jgi:hypothetical protein
VTVIAFRAGKLAADSLTVSERGLRLGVAEKIGRTHDGCLWAAFGEARFGTMFRKWAEGEREGDPPKWDPDKGSAILIEPGGRVREWIGEGWEDHIAEFYAWGVGRGPALGAMAMGADAETAVGLAIHLSVWCGPPIVVLELGEVAEADDEEPPPAPAEATQIGDFTPPQRPDMLDVAKERLGL